jgi:hypothetical protein
MNRNVIRLGDGIQSEYRHDFFPSRTKYKRQQQQPDWILLFYSYTTSLLRECKMNKELKKSAINHKKFDGKE